MNPKELVPGYGDKATMARFRELESRAGTLPVMFSLFFTEAIKIAALSIPVFEGVNGVWGGFIHAIQMLIAAIIVGMLYVYELDLLEDGVDNSGIE